MSLHRGSERQSVSGDSSLRGRGWPAWLLRLLVSVLLLGSLLRSVESGDFWEVVLSADLRLVSLSVMLFFPAQLWAAYRWYFLLRRLGSPLPFSSALRYNALAQFSALFLPGQISGDIVRAAAAARGKPEKASVAVSVLVDKLALLAAMVSLLLLGGMRSRQLSGLVAVRVVAVGLLVVSLLFVLFLCRHRNDATSRRLSQIVERVPWARRYGIRPGAWLHLPRLSYRTILLVLAMAWGLQLFYTAGSYVFARSLGIAIGVMDWAAINAAASVLQALPITIGGVGVRDGAFAAMLAPYEVPPAQAAAFSLLTFVVVTCLTSLGWFVSDSVSLHRLFAAHGDGHNELDVLQ